MNDAERQGRRAELQTCAIEAALATGIAMVIVTVVIWICANWRS